MMIEVNLLPQELRRVEHTPLPRFLVIIVGTTFLSIALAFGAIFNLRRLPDLQGREAALVEEIASAAQSEKEHDLLVGQIDEVKERQRAIAEIWHARIIWSRKLDELSEMMPKFIGLEKLTLEEGRATGRDDKVGGYLNLASVCAGGDVDRLAMFRRILRGSYPAEGSPDPWIGRSWFGDFVNIDATPWSRKEMPDEYEEKEALTFTLKLAIKPDAQRLNEFLAEYQKEQAAKGTSSSAGKARAAPKPVPEPEVSTPVSDVEPVTGTDVPVTDAFKEATR